MRGLCIEIRQLTGILINGQQEDIGGLMTKFIIVGFKVAILGLTALLLCLCNARLGDWNDLCNTAFFVCCKDIHSRARL